MPDSAYLSPCPFCGGISLQPVRIDPEGMTVYFVACLSCHTNGPRSFVSRENAAGLWNERRARTFQLHVEPGPGDDLAEHEKAIDEILDKFWKGKRK